MEKHIDIDLFKGADGGIYFIPQHGALPGISHNLYALQAVTEITDVCRKYNFSGFTLYLGPIVAEDQLD